VEWIVDRATGIKDYCLLKPNKRCWVLGIFKKKKKFIKKLSHSANTFSLFSNTTTNPQFSVWGVFLELLYLYRYRMPFTCPLCRKNWIFTSKLCDECEKIRHLIATYSLETVNNVLEKVLVINQFKQQKILDHGVKPTEPKKVEKPKPEFKKKDNYKNINT